MTGFSLTSPDLRGRTGPGLLAERARREPDAVAFRSKRLGLYRERTWSDYCEAVARCALGLEALGLRRGERVAIMGDPREEWVICDLAAQAAGAIPYGISPAAESAEIERLASDGGASVFIAEDQEQVDRILPLATRLGTLKAIVVLDASGMFAVEQENLDSYDRVLARGEERLRAAGRSGVEGVDDLAAALDPADPGFIVYTPGSDGGPIGAVIAHGKHLAAAGAFLQRYPSLARPGHRAVVHLSPCQVLGREAAITLPLLSGLIPHFGEELEDLPQALFEVAPTVLFTAPRYLRELALQILRGMANTSPVKRGAYDAAMAVGRRFAKKRWDRTATALDRAVYGVLHWSTLRPILNKIGFDRLELVICGGAPLAPALAALWQIYGVNVVEAYAPAETSGAPVAGQASPFPRPAVAGEILPGWEVDLGAEGEILVRGEDLFQGYWGEGEAAGAARNPAAGVETGDIGEGKGGALRVVGRANDPLVVPEGGPRSDEAEERLILEGAGNVLG